MKIFRKKTKKDSKADLKAEDNEKRASVSPETVPTPEKPAEREKVEIKPTPRAEGVQEIAILGGGPASLATAYYLTNQKDWQSRYSITIYQMGWRLGGKAASGRNSDIAERIEEHGIHIFGNYYKNIFDMVKNVNDETNWEYLPSKSMENTFEGTSFSANILWMENNRIASNKLPLPRNNENPWDGKEWFAGPLNVIYTILDTVFALLTGHHLPDHDESEHESLLARALDSIGHAIDKFLDKTLTHFGLRVISGMRDIAKKQHEKGEKEGFAENAFDDILKLMDVFFHWFRKIFGSLITTNVDHLSVYIQIDFYMALTRGFIADRLFVRDLDTIDHQDFREWLTKHGIDVKYTLPSPITRIAINATFQFENGDASVPSHYSAASFVNFTARAVLGKGPLIWKWIAGTGETIISPLYMALRKRGVNFKFFHKITQLHKTGNEITSIDLEIQATPKGVYEPLRVLKTGKYPDPFYVWGSKPDLSQLEEGDQLAGIDLESYWNGYQGKPATLTKGVHYDQVVLGISIGALPYICKEIIDDDPKWQRMIENVKTARTQACQAWFRKSLSEMGFALDFKKPDFAIGGTFAYPINDFLDFSDLIEVEKWDGIEKPKSLVYFCGPKATSKYVPPFSDTSYPQQEYQSTLNQSMQYFSSNLGLLLFPKATIPEAPTGFDFRNLAIYKEEVGLTAPDRMAQQYIRANIDPTELYVLSNAGSTQFRLHAWDSGIPNLTLVGDWIYTGFNTGAIEAAVMSGALGSFALTGLPHPETIGGYFFLHPDQHQYTKNVPHPLAKQK